MRRTWKVKLPDERVTHFASQVVPEHARLIERGYRLAASSGVWRTKRRGLTAKFVYRKRDPSGDSTTTFTFRDIAPA